MVQIDYKITIFYKAFFIKNSFRGRYPPHLVAVVGAQALPHPPFWVWGPNTAKTRHLNTRKLIKLHTQQLGRDHTKFWYVDGKAANSVDLLFYPTVEELFNEITRYSNTIYPIPPTSKAKQTDILIPLTNEEKVDQYEVKLQMFPFILKVQPIVPPNT